MITSDRVSSSQTVPLNLDFGHAPLGKLGQRSVQQQSALPPRINSSGNATPSARAPSLGTRLLNALAPHGMRVDSKARQGLHDVSVLTGKLLGTLAGQADASQPSNLTTVRSLLGSMRAAAGSLERYGHSYDKVLNQRLQLNLSKLPLEQLQKLHFGIANAISSNQETTDIEDLENIKKAIGQTIDNYASNHAKLKNLHQEMLKNDNIKQNTETLGKALSEVYEPMNLALPSSVSYGVGSFEDQKARDFEAELKKPFNGDQTEANDQGVCKAFWKDLDRADFQIQVGQKPYSLLFVKQNDESDKQQVQAKTQAVNKLKELTGPNPGLLEKVTQIANQNVFGPMENILNSKDSPLQLPNAQVGNFKGAQSDSITYKLRSDERGGVLVSCTRSVTFARLQVGVGMDAQQVDLDPQHSRFTYSFEVAVRDDLSVELTAPPSYAYSLKPSGE